MVGVDLALKSTREDVIDENALKRLPVVRDSGPYIMMRQGRPGLVPYIEEAPPILMTRPHGGIGPSSTTGGGAPIGPI
jgi:hypothetical protein